ncbi:transposase [Streptosporangium sp. NPDC023825]|uniref:transposase n=1 Tax=Streptosporangium sp. NPDC023825 TaxID=3154909 RepID=UPI00342DC084
MTRQVRTSPGAAYDLGYHVLWCPKYRRPVPGVRVKDRPEKLINAQAAEHGREVVALEVRPDHVHLFATPPPKNVPSFRGRRVQGPHLPPPAHRVFAPALPSAHLVAAVVCCGRGRRDVGPDGAALPRHAPRARSQGHRPCVGRSRSCCARPPGRPPR